MLVGTFVGLWVYGIDLSATLFGTPWKSSLPDNRVAMALEGLIVTVTILFGSLLVAAIIALAVDRDKKKESKDSPE